MKLVTAKAHVVIRHIEVIVEDNASIDDCYNALCRKAKNRLATNDYLEFEFVATNQSNSLPKIVGCIIPLERGWRENAIKDECFTDYKLLEKNKS